MDALLKWAESIIDLLLRMPVLVGVLGSWCMTQAYKWMKPPKVSAGYTDAYRAYRTRQVAFLAGATFTILAYMNPEVRTEASATICYGASLGFGVCTPPLKAFVMAPLVGIASIPLWDVLMFGVEKKWPEFYKRYISGKTVKTAAQLSNGEFVEVVTDSKGRFLKLRELHPEGDHDGLTVVMGAETTRPRAE